MDKNIRWDDLRIVYLVATYGSLSRAGEVLGVNHSTAQRAVGRIEEALASARRVVDERKLETMCILVPHAGKLAVSKGGIILFGCDKVRESFFPDARVSCARCGEIY